MKRWAFPLLCLCIVSNCLVPTAQADDPLAPGRATRFTVPLLTIPFGSSKDPDPAPQKDKEETPILKDLLKEKDKEETKEDKQKAARDKKIDDAIKKAWGTETPESPEPPK